MTSPIVYDVVMRVEEQAPDEQAALDQIAERIKRYGVIKAGIYADLDPIRDDNRSPYGKDEVLRFVNGYVVLTSVEKREILQRVTQALDAAMTGDSKLGERLLIDLQRRFDYLPHRTVKDPSTSL